MKGLTIGIVLILVTNLLITKSLVIKGDLTYNNMENAHNLPIILNDDVNDIEKRQSRARRIRRRRRRNQQINNLLTNVAGLQAQLNNLQSAINSRLASVETAGG